ncbi:MAG: hypothetical protein OXH57_07930 [Ekhidna sp.]|nr:hypothetical protein [Ekhidna sp.]
MKKTYEYENIQIGNFLVSVGYYLRDGNYSHPVAFNLNQQTPNDPTLGDLFGSFSGSSFLIEFKSHERNLKKELEKPARKRLIKYLNNPKLSELRKTSIRSHFLCYPTTTGENMNFNLKPYLKMNYEKGHLKSIKNFIEQTIDKGTVGATYKEIKEYTKLLEECVKEGGVRDSSGASSGILMNFDKEEGIKYILYDGFDDLNLKLAQSFDLNQSKKIEQKRNRGMSHGM